MDSHSNFGLLHHVEINVSNLTRTLEFWEWLLRRLGYVKSQEWSEGASWQKGATYLVFVQTVARHLQGEYHRSRVGLNHLAFHGGSRASVDAIVDELRSRGVAMLYEDRHPYAGGPGYYAAFFEDPDRIKVELVAAEED